MEVDTSAETGIADWNYIDYARVYGSLELPSAALISGTRQLLYIPDENSNGADSFVYVATDCAGDLFRSSFPGIISFEIEAVNDAPTAATTTYVVRISPANPSHDLDLGALVFDQETPIPALIVKLTHLPPVGAFFDGSQRLLASHLPHTIAHPQKIVRMVLSSLNGIDETTVNKTLFQRTLTTGLTFSVEDPEEEGLSASATLSLYLLDEELVCPSGSVISKVVGQGCENCPAGKYEVERSLCMVRSCLEQTHPTCATPTLSRIYVPAGGELLPVRAATLIQCLHGEFVSGANAGPDLQLRGRKRGVTARTAVVPHVGGNQRGSVRVRATDLPNASRHMPEMSGGGDLLRS